MDEAGSTGMSELASSVPELYVSALAEFEFLSTISRKRYEGELSAKNFEFLRGSFYGHWGSVYVQQPLSDPVFAEARTLLNAYRLRTLDAFQLASAVVIQAITGERLVFISADLRLLETAAREGFTTLDPSNLVK